MIYSLLIFLFIYFIDFLSIILFTYYFIYLLFISINCESVVIDYTLTTNES